MYYCTCVVEASGLFDMYQIMMTSRQPGMLAFLHPPNPKIRACQQSSKGFLSECCDKPKRQKAQILQNWTLFLSDL